VIIFCTRRDVRNKWWLVIIFSMFANYVFARSVNFRFRHVKSSAQRGSAFWARAEANKGSPVRCCAENVWNSTMNTELLKPKTRATGSGSNVTGFDAVSANSDMPLRPRCQLNGCGQHLSCCHVRTGQRQRQCCLSQHNDWSITIIVLCLTQPACTCFWNSGCYVLHNRCVK